MTNFYLNSDISLFAYEPHDSYNEYDEQEYRTIENINSFDYSCIVFIRCVSCNITMSHEDGVDEMCYVCKNKYDCASLIFTNDKYMNQTLLDTMSDSSLSESDLPYLNSEYRSSKKHNQEIVNPIIEQGTGKILRSCIITRNIVRENDGQLPIFGRNIRSF